MIPKNGKFVKIGGNVSSYFCTPEGRVLHGVGGPVSASRLKAEAQWATKLYQSLNEKRLSQDAQVKFVQDAHRQAIERVQNASGQASGINKWDQVRAHQVFAKKGFQPMSQVEDSLFNSLTGELFEEDRTAVLLAADQLKEAERQDRPVLLVLHQNHHLQSRNHRSKTRYGGANDQKEAVLRDFKRIRDLRRFEVIHLPQKQLAALTNLKELTGWDQLDGLKGSGKRRDDSVFVALSPQGEILSTLDFASTKKAVAELKSALAKWEQKKAESKP